MAERGHTGLGQVLHTLHKEWQAKGLELSRDETKRAATWMADFLRALDRPLAELEEKNPSPCWCVSDDHVETVRRAMGR
jgi:hypothetical protein